MVLRTRCGRARGRLFLIVSSGDGNTGGSTGLIVCMVYGSASPLMGWPLLFLAWRRCVYRSFEPHSYTCASGGVGSTVAVGAPSSDCCLWWRCSLSEHSCQRPGQVCPECSVRSRLESAFVRPRSAGSREEMLVSFSAQRRSRWSMWSGC